MLHQPAHKIHTTRRRPVDILTTAPAVTARPDSHQKCESRAFYRTANKKRRPADCFQQTDAFLQ
jgi:hypothetical protein